jgi:hypothetical protein
MTQNIEIARTFEDEKGDEENRRRCWRAVQSSHIVLATLSDEGKLYGSAEATKKTAGILARVQEVVDKTNGFDAVAAADNLVIINRLPDKLRNASEPLAKEARSHLGLDENSVAVAIDKVNKSIQKI